MAQHPTGWRKTSKSAQVTDCVEVARIPGGTAIRDTKKPAAGHITATHPMGHLHPRHQNRPHGPLITHRRPSRTAADLTNPRPCHHTAPAANSHPCPHGVRAPGTALACPLRVFAKNGQAALDAPTTAEAS